MNENKCIIPAFDDNNIVITLTSSDLYAPYAGVLIESLLENSDSSNNYDIIILETDISAQNKENLNAIIAGYDYISLRFVDISNIIDKCTFIVTGHHSKYNFYRLTIPEILSNYRKAIYLDCDLVINHDIAELYNIDIKDNYVAATRCIGMAASYKRFKERKEYVDNILKLKKPTWYFNSGVMLMNLEKIRKNYKTQNLLEMATSNYWLFCDQCMLNVLFEKKILFIPLEWNVLSHTHNFKHEKYLPKPLFTEYLKARANPKISHFAGNNIPVKTPTVDMYGYYWKYARNTPFYELLINRMIDERLKVERQIISKNIKSKISEDKKALSSKKPNTVKDEKSEQKADKEKTLLKGLKNKIKYTSRIILPYGTKRRNLVKKIVSRGKTV